MQGCELILTMSIEYSTHIDVHGKVLGSQRYGHGVVDRVDSLWVVIECAKAEERGAAQLCTRLPD